MKQKLLFPLPLVAEIEVTYTPKFPSDWQTLSTSDNVAKLLINAFRPETFCLQEAMYCLYLNRANKPLLLKFLWADIQVPLQMFA